MYSGQVVNSYSNGYSYDMYVYRESKLVDQIMTTLEHLMEGTTLTCKQQGALKRYVL